MNKEKRITTAKYLFALCLYGTIGMFLRFVDYSDEFVVLCRGILGSLFIIVVMMITGRKIDLKAINNNLFLLIGSGFALGFNWIFLFSGYRYGMAVSSLCNYLAPIIVVVIDALINKAKINKYQLICIVMAFLGMVLISGVFDGKIEDYRCFIYGLLAALGVVILLLFNRKLKNISSYDKTLVQLLSSAFIVFPYVALNRSFPKSFDLKSVIIVLILGFLHTGVAYMCYFDAIGVLSSQTIAILGYLEPVLNVLIGSILFHENIGIMGIAGAILIILSSIANEYFTEK